MNLSQTAILKWTFYALAAAALFFLRRLFLGSMTFFGVLPFLPPVVLAVVASFELPRSSVISGIVFGALCDLVLPAPFPCLYTVAFTIAALLPRGGSDAIVPMLSLFARETLLSCLLLAPVYPALRAVHRAFPD